ncbi:MAG: NUDIX hydrolase [Bacilli bacterium]|nr:NUDIX hydrolase [Bacilli bacterium]
MNYELVLDEFKKLKKEEFDYINWVCDASSKRILSESEKLEIYRKIMNYEHQLTEMLDSIREEVQSLDNLKNIAVEVVLGDDFLSSLTFNNNNHFLQLLHNLRIDCDFQYRTNLYSLLSAYGYNYRFINMDLFLNNQKLIEKPIYIFCGFHYSMDWIPEVYFDLEPSDYGGYEATYATIFDDDISSDSTVIIWADRKEEFEKDKEIIQGAEYISASEIQYIFRQELVNTDNHSIEDCVRETIERVKRLNYIRSPQYKEKQLLDRINELYKKVKGKCISSQILYSGNFIDFIRETYILPNERTVEKEKVSKNKGKNAVIIIAYTKDRHYIITMQNRINDQIIAEFPSGYIEAGEKPEEAAKRELMEETGYSAGKISFVDKAYTSPGIDNSITYVVFAKDCVKSEEKGTDGTEFLSYGLFTEKELRYLIDYNIMSGAMNKLAYYDLICNVDESYGTVKTKTINYYF